MTDFDLLKRIDLLRTNIGLEPLNLNVEHEGEDDLNRYLQEIDTSTHCFPLHRESLDTVKAELHQTQRLLQDREQTIELIHKKLKDQRGNFEEQLRQVDEKYQCALAITKEKYESLIEYYEGKLNGEPRETDNKTPERPERGISHNPSKETQALISEIERLNRQVVEAKEHSEKTVAELKLALQSKTEEICNMKRDHEENIRKHKEKCNNWKTTALKLKDGLMKTSQENETRLPLLKDITELHKLKGKLELEVSSLEMLKSNSLTYDDYDDKYSRALGQVQHWKARNQKLAFQFIKFLRGFYLDVIELKQEVAGFQDSALSESRLAVIEALRMADRLGTWH